MAKFSFSAVDSLFSDSHLGQAPGCLINAWCRNGCSHLFLRVFRVYD